MIMIKKNKIILAVAAFLIVLTCLFIYNYSYIFDKNADIRNKQIEKEYLDSIVMECNGNYNLFMEKWNDFIVIQGDYITLTKEQLLKTKFFKKKKYKKYLTDFYGYSFRFDTDGNMTWHGYYKP